MSAEHDQETARRARAREVGLFRYGLISDALDPALSTRQRGRLVRAVAAQLHPGPFSPEPVRVSRASLDRWIRAYRAGGFTALVPAPRRLAAQTPPEVLELAVGLKRETPGRTAAQVAVVLAAHAGWSPSPRTLQRHFAALGLNRPRPDGGLPAVFGRFEAERPNARWVGDALHGPHIGGRKAILIAFLDDHSRAVMAARWGYAENAVALRETLRQMNGINELITIAKYCQGWADPRVVVGVLNNQDLNQVTWELRAMAGSPDVPFAQHIPDFPYAGFAESLGLVGIKVTEPGQVRGAWERALAADRPCVVEFVTDPTVPPIPPHASLDQMESTTEALLRGDPEAWDAVKTGVKSKIQDFLPGR